MNIKKIISKSAFIFYRIVLNLRFTTNSEYVATHNPIIFQRLRLIVSGNGFGTAFTYTFNETLTLEQGLIR